MATLTGKNRLINKAEDAKEETRGASVEEARDLWEIKQENDNYIETETDSGAAISGLGVRPVVSLPSNIIDFNTNYESVKKWNLKNT